MERLDMEKTEPRKEEGKTGSRREAAGSSPESRERPQPSVRARSRLSGDDFSTWERSADFENHLDLGGPTDFANVVRTNSNSRPSRLSNQVATDSTARACLPLR